MSLANPRFLPPLNALKAFESAARLQSLTKAAEELYVTRAAVSQQVKQLEGYLGATLFERKGAKLTLTQDAEYYLPLLTQTFHSLSVGTEQLFARKPRHTVVVGVAQSFCTKWLIPRLSDFRRQYPDIDLKFSSTSNAYPNGSGFADIEIINGIGHCYNSQYQELINESWILVGSPDYLRGRSLLTIEQIAQAEKIMTTGYTESWGYWFSHAGYKSDWVKPALQFDHSSLSIEAALNGLGVVLVKDVLVHEHIARGQLIQVYSKEVPSEGGHYLICHNLGKKSVATFVTWLEQAMVTHKVETYG
ncbi:transcriptional regulator [Vibrio orientalis CIP 102891 = ATCC 33934]|uniref:Transcriptional regulator n=1 Tax=Vibrio orientalis CIP 102891 = ATCC 33934 TaxID=675816 RepID=C9QGK0_VIBOR|nr:LysR substrate-binding domain-containing protein [Vibrio orientalis]EEX93804.1 transcriptional regulator [Vibrio orientalis CIP 102891 = ATCC 33934]EGU50812.1 transcriptional regulator [Vibrio orientalis CIP 102891 = ATCC 33934]